MKYIHGKIEDCKEYRDWITGSFYPKDTINYDENVEIKVEYLTDSISSKSHYHSKRKSWIIVLQGAVHMVINGNPLTISKGEFIIYEPGVTEELLSTDSNTIVVSIHTPSTEPDKMDVSKT